MSNLNLIIERIITQDTFNRLFLLLKKKLLAKAYKLSNLAIKMMFKDLEVVKSKHNLKQNIL